MWCRPAWFSLKGKEGSKVRQGQPSYATQLLSTNPTNQPIRATQRRGTVRLQHAIDDRRERIELRAGRWLGAPVTRRHREGQHLAHRFRVNAEAPCGLALAQALNLAGVANPRVQFHRLHPTRPAADPRAGKYEGDGVLLRRSQLTHTAGPVRDFLPAA